MHTAIKLEIHSQITVKRNLVSLHKTVFYQYVPYCCTDDETGGSKHVAIYCDYEINCLSDCCCYSFYIYVTTATECTALR